jgi:toxin ParE1/3/4
MRELELVEAALRDLQRIADFADRNEDGAGRGRLLAILRSLDVLLTSPFIGRPSAGGSRELILGRGAHGYVARYRLDDGAKRVVILGVRGQREAGYDGDDDL